MFVGETIDGDTPGIDEFLAAEHRLSFQHAFDQQPLEHPAGQRGHGLDYQHGLRTGSGQSLPSQATGAFASRHPAGANFAFGDGHVKYISNLIDFPTYQALSTIAGSEPISGEY